MHKRFDVVYISVRLVGLNFYFYYVFFWNGNDGLFLLWGHIKVCQAARFHTTWTLFFICCSLLMIFLLKQLWSAHCRIFKFVLISNCCFSWINPYLELNFILTDSVITREINSWCILFTYRLFLFIFGKTEVYFERKYTLL